ncbi:MAG: transposase, partial [Bacteroidales bacterium]|nr:transposase [Bacteroidales bacterium]
MTSAIVKSAIKQGFSIINRGSKLHILNWIKRNEIIAKRLDIDIKSLKLNKLYSVLGDLANVQGKIEKKWFIYHKEKCKDIYLYDITSSYFEGTKNVLSAFGYNRDGKKGKKQIVIGLISNSEGFPLKIQVFEGNINDHTTVIEQLVYIKKEYQAENVIFVGDRGMRIRYCLDQMDEAERAGIGYITALSIEEIRCLLKQEILQLNMFTKQLAEVEDKDAQVRYVLCKNPDLEKSNAAKRDLLRNKFEEQLHLIQLSYQTRQKKNKENIEKLAQGNKNKKLITEFNEKQIDYYK